MLQELINLAEELYARGKNPYLAADANGAFMEEHAVKLGKMIEEVGKTLHYYHSKCQELHDNKVWMQLKIKKLEEAATMLRQQQAEIEALKQILAYEGIGVSQEYLDECVAELRKTLTADEKSKLIGTLKWAEDLLRLSCNDEAVNDVQDCLMILRKAQEK